jgi:hypothetical protein
MYKHQPVTLILFSFALGLVFLVLGFCVFLPNYFYDLNSNKGYLNATCIYEPGLVYETTCGCCLWANDCWFANIGLSAVVNVTAYIISGPYKTAEKANATINYKVGSVFGQCYYKDNGTIIIASLQNIERDFIVVAILLGMGFLILSITVVFYFCNKKAIEKKMSYTHINDVKPDMIV